MTEQHKRSYKLGHRNGKEVAKNRGQSVVPAGAG